MLHSFVKCICSKARIPLTSHTRPRSARLFSTSTRSESSFINSKFSLPIVFMTCSAALYYTTQSTISTANGEERPPPRKIITMELPPLDPDSVYVSGSYCSTGNENLHRSQTPQKLEATIYSKCVSKDAVVGEESGWVIDSAGKLFGWKKGDETATRYLTSNRFEQVLMGATGAVAVLDDRGKVYVKFQADSDFKLVDIGSTKVVKFGVGKDHIAVLTDDGEIYSMGSNERGQCGLVNLNKSVDQPTLLNWEAHFVDLGVGGHHTVAITKNGNVVSVGYNNFLQLGHDQVYPQYTTPVYQMNQDWDLVRPLDSPPVVSTKEFLTQYAHPIPAIVMYFSHHNINAKKVVCGDNVTFIIDQFGVVYAFGEGNKGQLAKNPPRTFTPPTQIRKQPFETRPANEFDFFSCGTNHCVLGTKAGEIWTWGFNSFSECGTGNIIPQMTPIRIMETTPSPIRSLKACQHATTIVL